ncbi:hypothetical protein Q3G72_026484 [Acer saccharum]|nr:hypothetical protein Q3G72_026484 [Acer saccharum]
MASNRGHGGIEQLLAAEQEAQLIVNAARNGHVVRDCLEKMEGDGPEDFNTLFGPWLRTDNSMKRSQGRQQKEDQGNSSVDKAGLGEVEVNPTLL